MLINQDKMKLFAEAFADLFEDVIEQRVEAALQKRESEKKEKDRFLSRKEAAQLKRVSEETISLWRKAGLLNNYGTGRKLLFSERELLNASLKRYKRSCYNPQ